MTALVDKKCVPAKTGQAPMLGSEVIQRLDELDCGWMVVDSHHLHNTYLFHNFIDALDFVNRIGEVAESEGHHPELTLSWGKVRVSIWTHSVDGLSESDFILAAKIDTL